MLDQNTFVETVREVSEIIRISQEPISKEKILSYFEDMELNEEQKEMVFQYFMTPHDKPVENIGQEEEEDKAVKQMKKNNAAQQESKVFQMYLDEMHALPSYAKEEMDKLYKRLLEGDERAVRMLSDAWLRRVLETAKKLVQNAGDLEDIIQEGNMALFLELTRLCGSGGDIDVEKALLTAVEAAMQKEISQLAGEDDDESAVIGRVSLVNEAKKYLTEENGREPSLAELLEYTKMTEDELKDVLLLIEKAL